MENGKNEERKGENKGVGKGGRGKRMKKENEEGRKGKQRGENKKRKW